jgi:Fe2+ or Zn2+ uptake regulation protein
MWQDCRLLCILYKYHIFPYGDVLRRTLWYAVQVVQLHQVEDLRVFKSIGIVKELTYGDASSRFDFNTHNHYHVIFTNTIYFHTVMCYVELCDMLCKLFNFIKLRIMEGDASSRFDFNTHNHYHVICEKCGKIVDFHYPQLDEVEQLAQHLATFLTNNVIMIMSIKIKSTWCISIC